jgi:hypothetical protein
LVFHGAHSNCAAQQSQGRTWTILLTNPNGMSCLIASGDLWESEAGPLVKPGKDA